MITIGVGRVVAARFGASSALVECTLCGTTFELNVPLGVARDLAAVGGEDVAVHVTRAAKEPVGAPESRDPGPPSGADPTATSPAVEGPPPGPGGEGESPSPPPVADGPAPRVPSAAGSGSRVSQEEGARRHGLVLQAKAKLGSAAAVAKLLGCSPSSPYDWINGRHTVPDRWVAALEQNAGLESPEPPSGRIAVVQSAVRHAGSQAALCRLLGVSSSTMCYWASGRREVPLEVVARIRREVLARRDRSAMTDLQRLVYDACLEHGEQRVRYACTPPLSEKVLRGLLDGKVRQLDDRHVASIRRLVGVSPEVDA